MKKNSSVVSVASGRKGGTSSQGTHVVGENCAGDDELQVLRSRLANGDDFPTVAPSYLGSEAGVRAIVGFAAERQAAPLRETALTEEERKCWRFRVEVVHAVRICKRFRSIRRARW